MQEVKASRGFLIRAGDARARALCRYEILPVVPRSIVAALTVTRCFSVNWTLTRDSYAFPCARASRLAAVSTSLSLFLSRFYRGKCGKLVASRGRFLQCSTTSPYRIALLSTRKKRIRRDSARLEIVESNIFISVVIKSNVIFVQKPRDRIYFHSEEVDL